jgi:hypothetical protein
MSTTSSSRASALRVAVAMSAAAIGCHPGGRAPAALPPDAPRAQVAIAQAGEAAGRPSDGYRSQFAPVELRTVRVRRLTSRDADLLERAGRAFVAAAPEPLVVEVTTERDLGRMDRTSSPQIYLNGTTLGDTWAVDANRLVAFLPDRRRIRERNSVTVAWLGNEEATRSRRALSFSAREVQ